MRPVKKRSHGFILTELMLALILSIYATTALCIWASSLITQRTFAQKKLAVVTSTQSLADQLSVDGQLTGKTSIEKEGVAYRWQIKSFPLNQLDEKLGKPDVRHYFKLIEVTASWLQKGRTISYTMRKALV